MTPSCLSSNRNIPPHLLLLASFLLSSSMPVLLLFMANSSSQSAVWSLGGAGTDKCVSFRSSYMDGCVLFCICLCLCMCVCLCARVWLVLGLAVPEPWDIFAPHWSLLPTWEMGPRWFWGMMLDVSAWLSWSSILQI